MAEPEDRQKTDVIKRGWVELQLEWTAWRPVIAEDSVQRMNVEVRESVEYLPVQAWLPSVLRTMELRAQVLPPRRLRRLRT